MKYPRLPLLAGVSLALAAFATLGCSTTFTPRPCAVDADCGDGFACVPQGAALACAAAADAPLRIGMSAALSGPSQALGAGMQLGVTLAFDAQNAAGGVRGRPLELDVLDDAYEPALAEQNTLALLDAQQGSGEVRCPTTNDSVVAGQAPVSATPLVRGPGAVLAMLGNVGTPTMVLSAPIALETQTLFFGAFTGATPILRDTSAGPCHAYVFNVRASYAEEALAALEYFFDLDVPDAAHLMSFDQDDSFGQSGYSGLVAAYTSLRGSFSPPPADPETPIPRFRYTRDDVSSVPAAVTSAAQYLGSLLDADDLDHTVGVLMTDTYGPATTFITQLRQWQYASDTEQMANHKATRLTLSFVNVSFVGPNALAENLSAAGTLAGPSGQVPYTDGVVVSQVVPNYGSDQSALVQAYNQAIAGSGQAAGFTSLEGYAAARIFVTGLVAHQGSFTPEALVGTFEQLQGAGLELGPESGYGAGDHDYSKSVWGTSLDASAGFQNRYFWTEGTSLSLFE
jgi:ABC-type branched-subunit amino acid transport system substrate-binding protein